MDPNNQNPQVGDIAKLEEDLQKLNSQALPTQEAATSTVVSSVNTTAPVSLTNTQTPTSPPSNTQVDAPVTQSPTVPHGFPTAIHNGQVAETVNATAQNPAFSNPAFNQSPPQPTEVKTSEPGTNPPGKKSNLVLTIAFVLMAVAVLAAAAYAIGNSSKKSDQMSEAAPTTTSVTATPVSSTESATPAAYESSTSSPSASTTQPKTVEIKNFAYSPATLNVKAGETVTVKNSDSVAHSLTEDTSLFDTGLIQPGESKTFIAPTKAGSYKVHCVPHPSITGTIVVEESGNPS